MKSDFSLKIEFNINLLNKKIFGKQFSECADAYGSDLVADQMICAGESGKDFCQVLNNKLFPLHYKNVCCMIIYLWV